MNFSNTTEQQFTHTNSKHCMSNMSAILLVLIFCIVLAASQVEAIDIITPANNSMTNNATIDFSYYVNMDNPTSCTLLLSGQQFIDPSVNHGMNTLTIQNLDEQNYTWSLNCENTTAVETSLEQKFTLDLTPPTLILATPEGNVSEFLVAFTARDDKSKNLTCTIINDGIILDEFVVRSGVQVGRLYTTSPGDHALETRCADKANNKISIQRNFTLTVEEFLTLSTNKQTYNLQEPVRLTINAPFDAEVTIDICPDEQGFVQCISPIIDTTFPQTITLPQNNQSGTYIIEGISSTPRETVINSTTYTTDNSMQLTLALSDRAILFEEYTLIASAAGGVGELTYQWNLSNGSRITTQENSITLSASSSGNKVEYVTVTDAAQNSKFTSISYEVEALRDIQVYVTTTDGIALRDVDVHATKTDVQTKTNTQGMATLRVEIGSQKYYVGKAGYISRYDTFRITENSSRINVTLEAVQGPLAIEILSPQTSALFTKTQDINMRFNVTGVTAATCALFMSQTAFLEEKSSMRVTQDGEQGFLLRELELGNYTFQIECVQDDITFASIPQSFIVQEKNATEIKQTDASTPTAAAYEALPDAEKELFSLALENLKTLGPKEQTVIDELSIDAVLREAKRRSGQMNKDQFDIKYRDDLSDGEKAAERARIQALLDELIKNTITTIEVLDSKTLVNYISKEELDTILVEHAPALAFTYSAGLTNSLYTAQQQYTMKTTVYRAKVTRADTTQRTISIVAKTLTYGTQKNTRAETGSRIIEVIPKNVAKSAKEITFVSSGSNVLVDDPVVAFPPANKIVYYVERDLSLSDLTDARTIFIPANTKIAEQITGFSVFGVLSVTPKMGYILAVLCVLITLISLAAHFGLGKQIKFFTYELGPKKKTHYMRVLINDIYDNLRVNNYEKAMMIYKEVKLMYDQLDMPTKNDVYEETLLVCHELDLAFARQLMLEMNKALKEERLDDAIEHYAKIEGTFERLTPEDQRKIRETVTGLANRLGVQA